MIDIKNKKCDNCNKRAYYGIPCNLPNKCVLHKEANMIKNPTKKCLIKNCNNISLYGINNPIHCEIHKKDEDIILVERECSKCNRIDILINNLCVNFCSMELKAQEIKKYQKVKEKRILKLLEKEYNEPNEYNVRVDYNCGGKNSEEKEIGYDFCTHKIFIEVDENQHKSYCKLGEVNRMRNIYMNEGGIPILFIRYNPDNFRENNKLKKITQNEKENNLIKWIKYYENFENIKYNLSVHYLYYNDFYKYGKENLEIDVYNNFEQYCSKCDNTFYIKSYYDLHNNLC
jgi:hypothetical protein